MSVNGISFLKFNGYAGENKLKYINIFGHACDLVWNLYSLLD